MTTSEQIVVHYHPVASFNLGGIPYQGYGYVLSKETVSAASTRTMGTGNSVHYIALIDRSGSMVGEINAVVDQVQKLFSELNPQDFFSLIWFSGEGDYKTLLKGAQYNSKLLSLLDTLRSVRNTTCFSESIQESSDIIQELGPIADSTVITLFTDGCPVVANVPREMKLCRDLVTAMRHKIVAFNTIGFGNYYNREFMQQLSAESDQGRYSHISRIHEFEPAYRDVTEGARKVTRCSVQIDARNAHIMYISGKTVVLQDNLLELNNVDFDDNGFVVLVPKNEMLVSASLTVNDERVHVTGTIGSDYTNSTDNVRVEYLSSFIPSSTILYGYASALYAQKKTKRAREVIVKSLGDKTIADAITSSFTYAEMGDTTKLLEEALVDPTARRTGTCPSDYIPAPDAACVMELLHVMAQSPNNKYSPFAYKNNSDGLSAGQRAAREALAPYQRVREKVTDEQNIFHRSSEEVLVSCQDLVYAEDRLNVSLRFTTPGTVSLNARAAARVGLSQEYPAKIYQTHTIIKDGNLNIPNAEFVIDAGMKEYILMRGIPHTALSHDRVILHLHRLPIINEDMMTASTMELSSLAEKVKTMTQKEAMQKVLNAKLQELSSEVTRDGNFATLTDEQIQVLQDHGVDKYSVYNGINNKREERTDTSDFYMVREISLAIPGISSLPSVASVIKKVDEGKKFTAREIPVAEALEEINDALLLLDDDSPANKRSILERILGKVKRDLRDLRNEVAQFKLGMVLNNDFEALSGLDFGDDGKVEFHGVTMKFNKVRQYV